VQLPEARLSSTYVASFRAAPAPPQRPIAWEFASPYLYTRWTDDGRLLVGGLDEDFTDPGARDALLERKSRELLERARALYPRVALEPEGAWCGTFGSTCDGLGFVGPAAGTPGILFVLGFGGNGITLSAAGAGIVADLVMGRDNADAALFALDRECKDPGSGKNPCK
jgi:glycine/D-amino acid oxidase-like deaminating enzyme